MYTQKLLNLQKELFRARTLLAAERIVVLPRTSERPGHWEQTKTSLIKMHFTDGEGRWKMPLLPSATFQRFFVSDSSMLCPGI